MTEITNGEEGSSVRTKLNNLFTLAESNIDQGVKVADSPTFNSLSVTSLSSNSYDNYYSSRSALVTAVAGGKSWADGTIVSDGTFQYISSEGVTEISDLTGLLPFKDKTPFHFGALGDGLNDDTAAIKTWLEYGGNLYAPEGTYLVAADGDDAGGVIATITESINITCDPRAVFKAGTGLDNDIIKIVTTAVSYNAGNRPAVKWSGGKFDMTGQKNSTSIPFSGDYSGGASAGVGTSATCSGLYIDGEVTISTVATAGFPRVEVYGVTTDAGTHWNVAGGDDHIFIGGSLHVVANANRCIGARDTGIYISGLSSGEVGGSAEACFNQFDGCVFGVSFKRFFGKVSASFNAGLNTAGVVTFTSVTTTGDAVTAIGNRGKNAWYIVRNTSGNAMTTIGNISKTHGHLLDDGSAPTAIFNGNNACVRLQGCQRSVVQGNIVDGQDATSTFTTASVLLDSDGTLDAENNTVTGNCADGWDGSANSAVYTVLEQSGEADYNLCRDNISTRSTVEPVVLEGVSSIDRDKRQYYSSNTTQTITGTTATTTLDSTTIGGGVVTRNGRIRVLAQGTITGTAGTKTFAFNFAGGLQLALPVSAASDAGDWIAEVEIYPVNTVTVEISAKVFIGSTFQGIARATRVSVDMDTDQTVLINGKLSNSADSIDMEWISVEVD